MIISRTPFRISFMGGGTDLPSFFKEEEGAVVSTTINKYMHITVNHRFDKSYRLSYSKTEIVEKIAEVEHPILRAVLSRHAPAQTGLEIISMADLPAGTGLGSSSSFTVGLLHALKSFLGEKQSAEDLAREACRIEIEELKEPIGKQDQYSAAYGGLRHIRFLPDGSVHSEPVITTPATLEKLENHMMIFFTGFARSASEILKEQSANTGAKKSGLREMKMLAGEFKKILEANGSVDALGRLLHQGWMIKKSLASKISSNQIDEWYQIGLKAGASGGKILGAGGGGFLLFLCSPENQPKVRDALRDLRLVPMKLERLGSRIIFVD